MEADIAMGKERAHERREGEIGAWVVRADTRTAKVTGEDEARAVVEFFANEAAAQFLDATRVGRAFEFG